MSTIGHIIGNGLQIILSFTACLPNTRRKKYAQLHV